MKKKTLLPPISEETRLIDIVDEGTKFKIHPVAADAWVRMKEAAERVGIQIRIVSAFRSIERQTEIIEEKKRKGIPEPEIYRFSAPPGFSEHHSGRAIDLNTDGINPLTEDFEKTKAFQWLSERGHEFGYQLSYPKGNRFGIEYEPWHWLYVEKHPRRLRELDYAAFEREDMIRSLKNFNRPLVLWPVIAAFAIACLLLFCQISVMRYQMYLLVSSSANQSRADGKMVLSYLAIIEGKHEELAEEEERLDRLRNLMIQRLNLSLMQLDGLHDHWRHKVGGYEIDDYREREEFERIREILRANQQGASNRRGG